MAAFEFRNAQEVGEALKRHDVRYLFFGKSGAILLGYSDTTQDVERDAAAGVLIAGRNGYRIFSPLKWYS